MKKTGFISKTMLDARLCIEADIMQAAILPSGYFNALVYKFGYDRAYNKLKKLINTYTDFRRAELTGEGVKEASEAYKAEMRAYKRAYKHEEVPEHGRTF